MSVVSTDKFRSAAREVKFAFENTAFFRTHMDAAGLTPADIKTPEDLRKIPPTQKIHYRKNFPVGVLAKGRRLDEPNLYRIQSSGTEGERLITVSDAITFATRWISSLSVNPGFSFVPKVKLLRVCSYAAPNCSDVECSNPNSTMQDRLLPDRTLILPVYHDLMTTPDTMRDTAAREMSEYLPHMLYIDATHLAYLVRHMKARGVAPPQLGAIVASYSLVTRVARRQITEFWKGVPFAEVVAMSEFGYLVMECPKGELHLNTEAYYMELENDGKPTADGEMGELFVTSLGDELSPHIRYRTGDYYRMLAKKGACGHRFPTVRCEGRATHMLRRDGKVVMTPRDVDDVIGDAPGLDVYQMHQVEDDFFQLRIIPNEGWTDADERELKDKLRARLGDGAELQIERCKYIPTERSGKFNPCKSTVSAKIEAKRAA